jgi:hypothetical protein
MTYRPFNSFDWLAFTFIILALVAMGIARVWK